MKRNELISIRDTIQSIWVAIVLAFVLRAFLLEAFVIPTGSMAPNLMGKHIEVTCPDCHYRFPRGLEYDAQGKLRTSGAVVCPNCGEQTLPMAPEIRGGDRVLVLKFPEQLRPLKRWDVVVFKDPQGNIQNYIKRLVGLPGEALTIIHGDIFVRPIADVNGDGVQDEYDLDGPIADIDDWQIARKGPIVQDAMWQILFDNDYQPQNSPNRRQEWQPLWIKADADDTQWDLDGQNGRVFQFTGEKASLRFARGRRDVFRATNTYNSTRPLNHRDGVGEHDQVGDLKLETTLAPLSENGAVRLTLSNFYREFAGEIHFDGRVRLLARALTPNGEPAETWDAATEWGATTVDPAKIDNAEIALTHADWRVTLWINGKAVLTSTDQQYTPDLPMLAEARETRTVPTPRVGITGLGGQFQLWHTRVMRDVFYTSSLLHMAIRPEAVPEEDYAHHEFSATAKNGEPGWGSRTNPIVLRKFSTEKDYDEFFMLGDNSPASKDSRRWVEAAPSLRLYDKAGAPRYRLGTVPRYNLIGKAFFVYWPAGTRAPYVNRLPIVPNVGKMRRID